MTEKIIEERFAIGECPAGLAAVRGAQRGMAVPLKASKSNWCGGKGRRRGEGGMAGKSKTRSLPDRVSDMVGAGGAGATEGCGTRLGETIAAAAQEFKDPHVP